MVSYKSILHDDEISLCIFIHFMQNLFVMQLRICFQRPFCKVPWTTVREMDNQVFFICLKKKIKDKDAINYVHVSKFFGNLSKLLGML